MKNWKTSAAGISAGLLLAIPQIVSFVQGQGGDWKQISLGALITLIGVLAKDFNVTNAAVPVAAQSVGKAPVDLGNALAKCILIGLIPMALLSLAGCAEYEKLTGLSGAQVSQIGASSEQQVLGNLYNGVASATTASLGDLAGPNAQNGQDVIEGAWIGAAESAGINSVGDLIADYGGPLVSSLGNYIDGEIGKLPASLQPAAKSTAAAAVQNVINAAAPAGAQPTSAATITGTDAGEP